MYLKLSYAEISTILFTIQCVRRESIERAQNEWNNERWGGGRGMIRNLVDICVMSSQDRSNAIMGHPYCYCSEMCDPGDDNYTHANTLIISQTGDIRQDIKMLNPWYVEYIFGIINIYWHVLSFCNTKMAQIIEIHPHGWQGPTYLT